VDLFEAANQLSGPTANLYKIALVVLLALSFKAVMRWRAMLTVGNAVVDVAAGLRLRLAHALLYSRWDDLIDQSTGAVAARFGRESLWAAYTYRNLCAAIAAALQALVYAIVI